MCVFVLWGKNKYLTRPHTDTIISESFRITSTTTKQLHALSSPKKDNNILCFSSFVPVYNTGIILWICCMLKPSVRSNSAYTWGCRSFNEPTAGVCISAEALPIKPVTYLSSYKTKTMVFQHFNWGKKKISYEFLDTFFLRCFLGSWCVTFTW